MKKVDKLTIDLTKKQLGLIEEYVSKKGYGELTGRKFYLLTEPRIYCGTLDIRLLTEKQGNELRKHFIKVMKLKK